MKNKTFLAIAIILVASMVLTACQPQTIIQTVEVPKEVEVIKTQEVVVEKTQVVEVEKAAFTTPNPILGDLKVRQAMAHCTNKADLAKAGYPLLDEATAASLVMDTMIPKAHWAYAGDANVSLYPFDVAKGGALLDEAGFKLPEGGTVRQKDDGTVLALKFYTTTAAFRQAWAAVWEKQMKDCGIQILRSHVPSTWWFGDTTGLQVRDFEIGAFAWVGEADPGGQTLWSCDQIPLPSNNWAGQNYMGWCNPKADEAIKNAVNTLDKAERIKWYTILQQEYTKDVPAIPVFNRTETFSVNAALKGFDPKPGEKNYLWNIADWELPGKDTIVLGFTQEPASLYTLVESAFVTTLAVSLTDQPTWFAPNYDYAPVTLTKLPTIESGAATNSDVEVKEGDMVLDVTGNPVKLAAGVKVKDATGAEVEFSSGTLKMKQLVVKYEFRPDLKWNDGTPVSQADYELGYKTACDRESGATSFITCDKTQKIEFFANGYTLTWLPGVQDATYFLTPYGYLPAHQKIESTGKTLAETPAKDYPTLKEVAEMPLGAGPYVLKEWVKGEKMVFEANPYWYGGAPKTKNIVIVFLSAENAEAQLLAGQVDTLGSETLAGLTDQLVQAEKDGKVKNVVLAGATWEHIDFNLFVK